MATIYGTNNDFQVPSLDLRFADRKNLVDTISGRNLITFTRASSATYVDANGVIQVATTDEPRFDHDPVTNESLGLLVEESRTNVTTYSIIDDINWSKTDGATITPNATLAPDGTFTAALVSFPGTNVPRINKYLTVGAGTVTQTVWIRAVSGTVTIRVGNGSDYGANQTIGTTWTRVQASYASGSNSFGIYCSVPVSTASFYAWGAQMETGSFPTSYIPTPATFTSRASTATYYDASGVIQTAAIDVARDNAYFPDENGVMQPAGLLLEAAATNIIFPSSPTSAAWSAATSDYPASSEITFNQSNPVSNTNTAASFNSGSSILSKSIGTVSDGSVISFYITGVSSTVTLSYRAPALGGGSLTISSSYSVTPSGRLSGAVAQNVGNGWYRISALTAGTSANCQISFSGGNSGVKLDLFQAETGSYPTSYIPTAGSTVTRAADVSSSSTVTRAADVATLTNSNIYNTEAFTITNEPFGASGGSNTLSLVGLNIKRTSVYSSNLSQATINKIVRKTDEFWRWRVTGGSFGLPNFTTDGQVTVDWGDGTVETLTTSDHAFTDGKTYHEIGFRLDSGTYFRPRINANSTHKDKLIAIGPAPESMKIRAQEAFNGCTNLQAFDPTIAANGETNYSYAWQSCSSLKNFPLIDTSGVTYMLRTWRFCSGLENFAKIDTSSVTSLYETWDSCSSLTSFPVIDTSNVTDFGEAWQGCSSLTEFPVLDTSEGTAFYSAWQSCSSLTEFPVLDTSKGTSFPITWRYCGGLTSFPALDFSSATGLDSTWMGCSGLTSFPTLTTTSLVQSFSSTWYGCGQLTTIPICDYSAGTTFSGAWVNCGNLTTIPANLFDTTGTLAANAFSNAFVNDSLSAQSIENLLVSLVANGATGVTLNMNGGGNANTSTWSTAANNAYLELVNNRGWTITQNGTAPT